MTPSLLRLAAPRLATATHTGVRPIPSRLFTTPALVALSRGYAQSSRDNATDRSEHLRRMFDDARYFGKHSLGTRTGLFGNRYLKSPHGLIDFSQQLLARAKALVADLLDSANTEHGKHTYVRRLDQLSDLLCRVIDVAEFIRVAHPQRQWVDAAQQTHEMMFEYMNQLNTNVELYTHLRDILTSPQVCDQLTPEEIEVGEYLRQDFERLGIAMDPETRDNFVAITQQILVLGSQFNAGVLELAAYLVTVPLWEVKLLPKQLQNDIMAYQSKFATKAGPTEVQIPLVGPLPYRILVLCPSESLRRRVWIALHNLGTDQVATLNQIVQYRAYLAHMLGYLSFSAYQLEHKMARHPTNVLTFLSNLQQKLRPGVEDELRELVRGTGVPPLAPGKQIIDAVKPWDRDYLLNRAYGGPVTTSTAAEREGMAPPLDSVLARDNEAFTGSNPEADPINFVPRTDIRKELEAVLAQFPPISEYLSVGTVVAGLLELFQAIYNVELIPEAAARGETWESQVRKLRVYDHTKGETMGFLYLDFWSAKVLPSHFTIVCLRKLNRDLGDDVVGQVPVDNGHQLPVVLLVCNFAAMSTKPTLLTLEQVDTIFHEMGHAMHLMIGRTDLHNLLGTRCATDFVELPLVLMELFAKDPRVLCRIGRHIDTDEPLPKALLQAQQQQTGQLSACEAFMQLKMAMLDQVLHDELVIANLHHFDSTPVYHGLEKHLQVFADTELTWHGKFPHLFSYGLVYYLYLLDRAIAEKVWQELFEADPWLRTAGDRYKNAILKWGGTRDPWLCLADALQDSSLAKGDAQAMETIVQ